MRERKRNWERGDHQRKRIDREQNYSSSSEVEYYDRRIMGVRAMSRDPERSRIVKIKTTKSRSLSIPE